MHIYILKKNNNEVIDMNIYECMNFYLLLSNFH